MLRFSPLLYNFTINLQKYVAFIAFIYKIYPSLFLDSPVTPVIKKPRKRENRSKTQAKSEVKTAGDSSLDSKSAAKRTTRLKTQAKHDVKGDDVTKKISF